MSRSFASLCAWSIFGYVMAHSSSSRVSGAICDFKVYYNRWVPTFSPAVYRHRNPNSGMHCLAACCADPSCEGLALQSSLISQCYKYTNTPRIADEASIPLVDFLAGERISQWSVFVKTVHESSQESVSSSGSPALSDELMSAIAARPRPAHGMVSEETLLDKRLRGVDPVHNPFKSDCEWTVFYDQWIPTFDHGEYTHDDVTDGPTPHCLQKCCDDPLCKGLSLESSELDQCYKYGAVPHQLSMLGGKRLGDGHWLRHKPKAWSIFVKSTHPVPVQVRGLANNATITPDNGTLASAVSSSIEHARGGFVRAWLSNGLGSKLRWIALVVALASFLALAADSLAGNIRKRTVFELKLRSRTGAECSPLLRGMVSSRAPEFGAAVYADAD